MNTGTTTTEKEGITFVAMPDLTMVIAIAVIAYSLTAMLHEGIGHGGACVALGGRPLSLSSCSFGYDDQTATVTGHRLIAIAGPLMNLFWGLSGWWLLSLRRSWSLPTRYFLWLFGAINLFQVPGYMAYSGLSNFGDWAVVIAGTKYTAILRLVLVMAGVFGYSRVIGASACRLSLFVDRRLVGWQSLTKRLTVVPYVTGGILFCVAGSLNPDGMMVVAISAAAASLGGTSGLLSVTRALAKLPPDDAILAWCLAKSWPWLAGALTATAIMIGVLGPSIALK